MAVAQIQIALDKLQNLIRPPFTIDGRLNQSRFLFAKSRAMPVENVDVDILRPKPLPDCLLEGFNGHLIALQFDGGFADKTLPELAMAMIV